MPTKDPWDDDTFMRGIDFSRPDHSSVDAFLTSDPDDDLGPSLQDLTDAGRAKNALRLPVKAGTRVRFDGNLGALLTHDDPPVDRLKGTVVVVRTASGDTTSHDGLVFVDWDDGVFRPIHHEYLRKVKSRKGKKGRVKRHSVRVASLGDLDGFLCLGSATDDEGDLVHKATNDLWSFRRDGDDYVIERLFDENGQPLKV